ncbi:Putative 2-epi-5-epi-valiolone synthase [gamma proteobacterium HdN1]|nr:Putative 2-epi-5-epi-valiolone synthase [gamma proteobacterium HdN1]
MRTLENRSTLRANVASLEARQWRVSAQRPISYDILSSYDLFHPENDTLLSFGRVVGAKRFVVVDSNVYQMHHERIGAWFETRKIEAKIVPFVAGEEHKTLESWQAILAELDKFPIHRRDDPIIAIGGGVLTDVVGFAAGCYRRGVPHIKIPTTLMGYVDASVGIKTGINFQQNKNRVGNFEVPLAVLLDRRFLATQSRRHLLNGICEILKLAIVCSEPLFSSLECFGRESVDAAFQNASASGILTAAITEMIKELEPNLFESELSRRVDFGHTFSYGLEAAYPLKLLHGEAVLLDILASVFLAKERGLLSGAELARICSLVKVLGIEPELPLLNAPLAWRTLQERMIHRNGRQHVPVPKGIGNCVFLEDVSEGEIAIAIKSLHQCFEGFYEPSI